MRFVISSAYTFLVLVSAAPALPAAEITTLDGKKYSGDLVRIDEAAVVVKTGSGEESTPVPRMLVVETGATFGKPPDKFIDVELVDGSLLHCKQLTLRGKQVELVILPEKKLTLPMEKVLYILVDAQDQKTQKEWQEILADKGKRDRFYVRKDDRLDGLDGTFGDADADGKFITFQVASNNTTRKLPIDKLQALLFNNRLEGNIAPRVCKVVDTFQNQFVATKVVLKGQTLSVLTVAGISVEFASLNPIAKLDYSQDKIVFLSDLRPKEEGSTEDLIVQWRRDQNLDNQPIQLEGTAYAKGLVLHPSLTLVYDINGDYKEFKAVLGVDPNVQTPSDVQLTFEGDGRKLFETEVKRGDKPMPIVLDVKKIKQLKITVVTASGLFDYGNQVTLADAKVSK
ncbi:MAG TPA: NPCBM/NEW2 domain-containing protein [Gemmataceae bacterium]|nr:NPCBM/NEW2 domain-containing protein [Gemmataceae bacterium]